MNDIPYRRNIKELVISALASLAITTSGCSTSEDDNGTGGGTVGSGGSTPSQASCGNGICEAFAGAKYSCDGNDSLCTDSNDGETMSNCPQDCSASPKIRSVTIGDRQPLPFFGDIWTNTWVIDDYLAVAWGDGTGYGPCHATIDGTDSTPPVWSGVQDPVNGCFVTPEATPTDGQMHILYCNTFGCPTDCQPPCPWTDSGFMIVQGTVPSFQDCGALPGCIVNWNVPTGITRYNVDGTDNDRDDKPHSLLSINGRLYWSGHSPLAQPEFGYLAYSDDLGQTWHEIPNTPWTTPSPFRVRMFINMGENYGYNTDGYVYALAMGTETNWSTDKNPANENKTVYLCRVPKESILDYNAYEYLVSAENDVPDWNSDPDKAKPVAGLRAAEMGSVSYHKGTERYLFITAMPGALFEAPQPWGPWTQVARIFEPGASPSWDEDAYIPNFINKEMGSKHLYFSISSGGYYNMNMIRMDLDT